MTNVLTILILLALVALFVFLTVRAARARRAWIKWPGMLLSGLLGLLFLAVTAVALLGFYQMNNSPYTHRLANFKVASTSEKVAHGERMATICLDCHSSTGAMPLDGSKDNLFAGGPPLGVLYAPNLTPGGPLKDWSDAEILRAMREGIGKDGKPLMVMPSEPFHHLSDADAEDLIAYLRAQPSVKRDLPQRDLNVVAALIIGSGMFHTSAQPPITEPIVAPQKGTVEYGKYLAYSSGCRDCHGPDLRGGTGGFGGDGPNLVEITASWSEAEFTRLFREGVDPTGRQVDPLVMPWKNYGPTMTDDQLSDLYNYLHTLKGAEASK